MSEHCRVYWGSHGCMHERGHDGPHACCCAFLEDGSRAPREDEDGTVNVGAPPYYGPDTIFYGEDAARDADRSMAENTARQADTKSPSPS